MQGHIEWEGIWHFKHVRDGKVIWEEHAHNDLVNQGESMMLDSFFRNQQTPSQFYVRLCYDTVGETDTLSSIRNEPVGNGYSAVELPRDTDGWPTLELHNGDYRISSKEANFTASGGDIGPVDTAYLANTIDNTGSLIAIVGLSVERTIIDGDTMYVTLRIKLK